MFLPHGNATALRLASALAAALAALLLAASSSSAATLPPGFQDTVVWNGLTNPTAIEFSPDGRIFVAEKRGLIKVFDSLDDPTPTTFADLRTQVYDFWDRGMLGLALHPNFPASPSVYVAYSLDGAIGQTPPVWNDACPNPPGSTADGCVIGARLSVLTASGNVSTGEQVLIEDWCQQYPSHSIGALAFGPDGMLYMSGGEGAAFYFTDYGQKGSPKNPCGDPPVPVGGTQSPPSAEGGALRSQDLRTSGDPVTLDGTILRLDPATGAAAPGNPLGSSADANARRIIAYGLRNPFRFAFRPGTQEIYTGDVGWDNIEEINRIPSPSDSVVENFGWPCYEGLGRQSGYDSANLTLCENLYGESGAVTPPFWSYAHSAKVVNGESCPTGSSSVTGIAFYQGGSYPAEYAGAMFFADYSRNCIWAMLSSGGVPDPSNRLTFVAGAASPVDLKIGPGGDLFYVDFNGGTVHRVVYFSANQPPSAVAVATSPTSGPLPLTVTFNGSGSSDPNAGDTLSYAWDLDGDGQFDDSTAVSPSFTYTTAGTYSVRLRVSDNHGASTTSGAINVVAGGPAAAIAQPSGSTLWRVGQTIAFSGSAVDGQGNPLPASSLSWSLTLHHCSPVDPLSCHEHPVQTWPGVASGSFDAPDHEYPSYLKLSLTATDGQGLQDTESVRLDPETVVLTFESVPSGLQLTVGSTSGTTPFTRTAVIGSTNSLSAEPAQVLGGGIYTFQSWSDGGAASHDIVAPATPTTYTATYTLTGSSYAGEVLADGPLAYWRLGEPAGSTQAADASGNGHTGSYVNGVALGVPGVLPGDPDTAAGLDGTNDHLQVTGVGNFPNRAPFSVEIWVKPDVFNSTYRRLFSTEWNDGNGRQGFDLRYNSSYGVTLTRWLNGSQIGASSYDPLTTGQWHHIVGTYDGTTIRVYVDGAFEVARTDTRNLKASSAPLYIGRFPTGGQYVDGDIDEAVVYPFALSAARVQAHYEAATSGGPAPDTTPPETTITSGPSGPTASTSVSFQFTSTEAGSTFACSLDSAPLAACTSPASYSGLSEGPHIFEVRATDLAGNVDATPASRSFTVDVTPPETTIDSGPAGTVSSSSASFTFSSNESGATFGCSLDGAAFSGCTSPQAYSGLANGEHTFRVRATDAAGNIDFTAATRTWTVNVPPPSTSYSAEVLADGPRGYWRLGDAAESTQALDASGNGFTGSYQNGAQPGVAGAIAGDADTAIHLDGTNDYVSIPGVADFAGRAPFTVEAWVKVNNVDTVFRRIFSAEYPGTNGRNGYALHYHSYYGFTFARWVNGSQVSASSYDPPANSTWHHVVATYDGSTIRVYVDGGFEVAKTDTRSLQAITQPLIIGRFPTGGQYLGGDVDEAAVYPTALSAARILAHYDAGTP